MFVSDIRSWKDVNVLKGPMTKPFVKVLPARAIIVELRVAEEVGLVVMFRHAEGSEQLMVLEVAAINVSERY